MSAINFRPYIKVYLKEEEAKVILSRPFTDNNLGRVFELTDVGIAVIKHIGNGMSQYEITNSVARKFPNSEDEIGDIFKTLFEEKYIEEYVEITDPAYLKLEKEYGRLLPIWSEFESEGCNRYQIQMNIMNKKVGVVGCGTIGFGIVSKLVTSGVGNFVLFDNDVVEESNLARQTLFSLKDIGRKKVNCVEQFILDRKHNGSVATFPIIIESEQDLEPLSDVDIVVVLGIILPMYR